MNHNIFVVYSVLVGKYDTVRQPLVVDERFDYILFTDSIENETVIGLWQLHPITYKSKDPVRVSRYPKMHPEELLSKYKASLYIDANVQIIDKKIYERVIDLYSSPVDWSGISPYPAALQDCIYEHAYWAMINNLESEEVVFKLCHFLRHEGYPQNYGLLENNAIFRKHNEACHRVNLMWWDMYCRFSRRDQLTLGYAFWKNPDVKVDYLLPKGERVFDSKLFKTAPHNDKASKIRILKTGLLAHYRNRLRAGIPELYERFRNLHYKLYALPVPIARVCLCAWSIYGIIVYGPRLKHEAYKRHRKRL